MYVKSSFKVRNYSCINIDVKEETHRSRPSTPKRQKTDGQTPLTEMTPSQRTRAKAKRKVDFQKALKTHVQFNIPKLHSLLHFERQICLFGAMPQHSTEIGECSHKKQLKEGFARSNKQDVTWQIINCYARRQGFAMRVMNLRHLIRTKFITDVDVIKACKITGFGEQGDTILAIEGPTEMTIYKDDKSPLDDDSGNSNED